jgi:chorismate synthase
MSSKKPVSYSRSLIPQIFNFFKIMSGNSFGSVFKITSFGESHGIAIGVVIDGCPAGLDIGPAYIQRCLDRRRPGQSTITTARNEEDKVQILSGVFENKSTGAPIALLIYNKDQQSQDYDKFKELYRPSHADFTYDQKYGFRDHRGGGRSSARETATRVAAGAIANQLISTENISIHAFVSQVGPIMLHKPYQEVDFSNIDSNIVRCPDNETAKEMISFIEQVRNEGDSVGGVITCIIKNCPVGLGEPVFDKLHADLGKAMLSINAVKGFEIGSGFSAASMRGSKHNDAFVKENNEIKTSTNNSGGVQGGISNGADIYFRVAFKPVATIATKQSTITNTGEETTLEGKGRHDPCVVPRAVPIVEAMAALVLADHMLRAKVSKL